MHLQQTKVGSRASGGPQYYFHDVPDHVKEFLRRRGACPVVLQTPYGIAASRFMAVGWRHKLGKDGTAIAGNVGHDRIQQAKGQASIGEAIRHWYGLEDGTGFERIAVTVDIHPDGHFILVPLSVRMRGGRREKPLERVHAPLSFHRDHQSKFWRRQLDAWRRQAREQVEWAAGQIARVADENRDKEAKHILESDVLRAAGALSILGMSLSPYLGQGYDCLKSHFDFHRLPRYPCPVEVKKRSSGFTYQVKRYTKLPRAVVLCMTHDMIDPPDHIDFVELPALAEFLSQ